MEQTSGDRRKATRLLSFPLLDDEGHKVMYERRSGMERRKIKRDLDDVAVNILNILN